MKAGEPGKTGETPPVSVRIKPSELVWRVIDDHPGPIRRRHSSVGGEADQSLAILTPGTTPFRAGPRNPGHSAGLPTGAAGASVTAAGEVATGSGVVPTGALGSATGAGTVAAGVAGGAIGSSFTSASSRSSAVGVHRHRSSNIVVPPRPSVLSNVTKAPPGFAPSTPWCCRLLVHAPSAPQRNTRPSSVKCGVSSGPKRGPGGCGMRSIITPGESLPL